MFLNKKVAIASAFPFLGGVGFLAPTSTIEDYKIMVNYNGQADLLLSLQIFPDYYPYQFKKTTLYDYLTNVNKYLVQNDHTSEDKKRLKNKLQERLNKLLGKVKEFGPSLWNEDLYETGLVFKNDQQWSNRKTSILFLEQFIADDFTNIEDSANGLPTYKDLIITNYRAARDPYTIFSKEVFECFKKEGPSKVSQEVDTCSKWKEFAAKFKNYVDTYNGSEVNSLYRFGKYIEFWNRLFENNKDSLEKLNISSWIKQEKLFALDDAKDKLLAGKYTHTIFTDKEISKLNEWFKGTPPKENEKKWEAHYTNKAAAPVLSSSPVNLAHHPALEQTPMPGSAPLAEGSQKEVVVFLFQFAALIDEYVKKAGGNFQKDFAGDERSEFMKNALINAKVMASNLETRITAIRKYFQSIDVVDKEFDPTPTPTPKKLKNSDSKAFAIVTYPPASFGAGEATIQSMSKFPFLYTDIGLRQVFPNNLSDSVVKAHDGHDDEEPLKKDIFSVDDNGWWWKIGNVDIDSSNLFQFEKQADTLLVLANPEDWNLINDKNAPTLKSLSALLKDKTMIDNDKLGSAGYPVSYQKYHLWNEGLRSPIALNLLLDNLVDIFQKQYDPNFQKSKGSDANSNCYKEAMDWGDYWYNAFIEGKSCENVAQPTQTTKECKV